MKNVNFPITLLIGTCSVVLTSGLMTRAADPPQADSATPAQTLSAAPARLPYGVEDIVKLSKAQISEDVILNYVRNSGTVYNLAPADIVALRNEGVSDHVINAMLDQRKNVPEAAAQAQPAPAPTVSTPAIPTPGPQPDYQAAEPPAVYMETTAPSSVYVIPYPAGSYAYYSSGYYPYYGGYYGYCGPYYYHRGR